MKKVSIDKKVGNCIETTSRLVAETPEEQAQLDREALERNNTHVNYINQVWGGKSYYKGAR